MKSLELENEQRRLCWVLMICLELPDENPVRQRLEPGLVRDLARNARRLSKARRGAGAS
jgi:hypothetical protein